MKTPLSEFDEMLADCTTAFTEPFGERVIFKGLNQRPRVLSCIVDRHPVMLEEGRIGNKMVSVFISSDIATGLRAPPQPGADKINLPWNLGEAPEDFLITEFSSQDGGGWQVTLKR